MPIPGRLQPAGEATLDTTAHFLCTCWRITPSGLGLIYLTNHPRQIELFNFDDQGDEVLETYTPVGGANSTARRGESDLRSRNVEVRGILESDAIQDSDIKLGRYQHARIDEYIVDYRVPFQGPTKKDVFWVRNIGWDGHRWRFELDGIASWLQLPITEFYQPNCTVDLFSSGDGKCNASSTGFIENGLTIQTIINRRTFTVNSTSQAEDFWKDGTVHFPLAGAGNAFQTFDILRSFGTDGQTIELALTPKAPIALGEQVTLTAGCNKQPGAFDSVGHCKNKFNNLENFQGENLIPGYDRAVRGVSGL